jgi:hypothetical protein
MLRILSPLNRESCSKYSNLATCQVLIFLEQRKASILNWQFWAELEIWKKMCNQAEPTSQWPKPVSTRACRLPDLRHSPPTQSSHGDRAHGEECRRRSLLLPMPRQTLSDDVEGSLPFPFLLPRHFCSASLSAAALLHIAGHLCPRLSLTKSGNCTAFTTPRHWPTTLKRAIHRAVVFLSPLHLRPPPSKHLRPRHHVQEDRASL